LTIKYLRRESFSFFLFTRLSCQRS
jgi:hypothetical protein